MLPSEINGAATLFETVSGPLTGWFTVGLNWVQLPDSHVTPVALSTSDPEYAGLSGIVAAKACDAMPIVVSAIKAGAIDIERKESDIQKFLSK